MTAECGNRFREAETTSLSWCLPVAGLYGTIAWGKIGGFIRLCFRPFGGRLRFAGTSHCPAVHLIICSAHRSLSRRPRRLTQPRHTNGITGNIKAAWRPRSDLDQTHAATGAPRRANKTRLMASGWAQSLPWRKPRGRARGHGRARSQLVCARLLQGGGVEVHDPGLLRSSCVSRKN